MNTWQTLEYILLKQGGTYALINGLCHLYSNSSKFSKRDIIRLNMQTGWLYNLQRGNLSTPSIGEIIKYNLPFLKNTPLRISLTLTHKIVNFNR